MPVRWNDALNGLIVLLAGLYPDGDRARGVVNRVGLDPTDIDLHGAAKIVWMRIVEEANRRELIRAIIQVAKSDYPNVNFVPLVHRLDHPDSVIEPRLADNQWKGTSNGNAEKVMGAQPTFLPLHFLAVGLLKSRAVARVTGPKGVGTGFLIRNGLFVTNHHVLSEPDDARRAEIWFNYEQGPDGAQSEIDRFSLDPDVAFATSPLTDGDDWTVVGVKGDLNQWGHLDLLDVDVAIGDYVNIIQHPGGLPKQIALYHNVVEFADGARVQYLTDTMPGSSGSPVFDSLWRVVALHHKGGWLTEPGTDKIYFRNQGIHVRALARGLREAGVLDS
jgi:hypothetical protein